MSERERLHALVDILPDDELRVALRFLEFLETEGPASRLWSFQDAPIDDEPLTAEEELLLSRPLHRRWPLRDLTPTDYGQDGREARPHVVKCHDQGSKRQGEEAFREHPRAALVPKPHKEFYPRVGLDEMRQTNGEEAQGSEDFNGSGHEGFHSFTVAADGTDHLNGSDWVGSIGCHLMGERMQAGLGAHQ